MTRRAIASLDSQVAHALNAPDESNLSDDELLWLHVFDALRDLHRDLSTKGLSKAQRNVLQRLLAEVTVTGVDDLDRRFFRGVSEVEEAVRAMRQTVRPLHPHSAAEQLLLRLEHLRFAVHEHWSGDLDGCSALLQQCRLDGQKGKYAPAGVLGRILFAAGAADPGKTEAGFIKRINSACGRERGRREPTERDDGDSQTTPR